MIAGFALSGSGYNVEEFSLSSYLITFGFFGLFLMVLAILLFISLIKGKKMIFIIVASLIGLFAFLSLCIGGGLISVGGSIAKDISTADCINATEEDSPISVFLSKIDNLYKDIAGYDNSGVWSNGVLCQASGCECDLDPSKKAKIVESGFNGVFKLNANNTTGN